MASIQYKRKKFSKKDVKEDYCSSCNGSKYSPNIFTGTTISNITPRDQLWKTVPLTDRSMHNGISYPVIPPQKVSDNHNIYNISSRYNTNPHRNPMRYHTNVNDCDYPSHYKELNLFSTHRTFRLIRTHFYPFI